MKKFTIIMIKTLSYDVLTNPLPFWPQKEEGVCVYDPSRSIFIPSVASCSCLQYSNN